MSMLSHVLPRSASSPAAPAAIPRAPTTAAPADSFSLMAAAILMAVTLAGHGWSIFDGPFLDDHLHQHRLAQIHGVPSPHELLWVTTIAPDEFIHCWWQDKSAAWQYARPFSVLVMKVFHTLFDGRIPPQRLVSLAMHYAIVLLVYRLSLTLTRHRGWSVVAGGLFAVYTHTIIPVAWLAAQNAIQQTLLTLAALMLYVRASGLDLSPDAALPDGRPLQRPAFAGVVVCALLSILSREVGVILPILTICLDLAFGGRTHVWRRRGAHLTLLAISAAFVAWRMLFFYQPLPEFYARTPQEPGYLLWCAAKLLHYLASAVWLTPMTIGPTGRINPFTEAPFDCLLMASILVVMSTGYYCACRNLRGWWIWPLWILLSVLPVVPIMATPHTGYMAGVGFAIAMVIGPALRAQARPVGIGRWSRPVAGWFMFATLVYVVLSNVVWKGLTSAELATITGLSRLSPPTAEQKRTYLLNLPFVNIYAPIQAERVWGEPARRSSYHVLAYSPDLLYVDADTRIEQLDDHRFTLTVGGRPYFYGALGRYLIEAMRQDRRLPGVGETIRSTDGGFDVHVVAAEEDGIRTLEFEFDEPLWRDDKRFILATRDNPAAEVRFRRMDTPAGRPETLPIAGAADATADSMLAVLLDRARWVARVRALVARGIRTDLYFTGPPYPGPRQ